MKYREQAGKFQVFVDGRWRDWRDVHVLKENRWRPWRNLAEARRDAKEDDENGEVMEIECKDVLLKIEEICVDGRINDEAKVRQIHDYCRQMLKDIRGEHDDEDDDVAALAGETEEQKKWRAERSRQLAEQKKQIKKKAATPEGVMALFCGFDCP